MECCGTSRIIVILMQCVASQCDQTNTLGRLFASHLGQSGQTHRFRHCSVAATGVLEYPKTNSRNGNKEKLYFTLFQGTKFKHTFCAII